jgi:hypothetical protein
MQLIASMALVLVVLLLTACGEGGKTKPEAGSKIAGPAAGEKLRDRVAESRESDKHVEKTLASKDAKHAEARAWLKADNHGVFKQNKTEVAKLIDAVYAAGAPNVEAADVVVAGSSELCAMFVVTLPTDAKARAAVLETVNPFFTGNGEEPGDAITDVGQKYVELLTD